MYNGRIPSYKLVSELDISLAYASGARFVGLIGCSMLELKAKSSKGW